MSSKADEFEKARDYAFLLLKFRLRSENELIERLKRKNFSEDVARRVASFLKDKNFIDDNLFAKNWIDFRLKRPFGLRRIRQELKAKGVESEVVESQIGRVIANYSEAEIVSDLIRLRLSKLKGIEPAVAKRRIYGYLIRRGFSCETIINNLNRLCR